MRAIDCPCGHRLEASARASATSCCAPATATSPGSLFMVVNPFSPRPTAARRVRSRPYTKFLTLPHLDHYTGLSSG